MKRLISLYDFLTFLFIVAVVSLIIFLQNPAMLLISFLYILIYTILIIILGFKVAEKTSYKVFVLVGSLILIGIMPFIYYITYFRGLLKKQMTTSSIKQQVLDEIRKEYDQNGSISTNNPPSGKKSTSQ